MQQRAAAPTSSRGLIEFTCDLSAGPTPLSHFWEHTIASAHAAVALCGDCHDQLHRAHYDLGFRYLPFHGLLSDRMGTLISGKEEFPYSFFNTDQIVDFLLSIGMKPLIKLSFMPDVDLPPHSVAALSLEFERRG